MWKEQDTWSWVTVSKVTLLLKFSHTQAKISSLVGEVSCQNIPTQQAREWEKKKKKILEILQAYSEIIISKQNLTVVYILSKNFISMYFNSTDSLNRKDSALYKRKHLIPRGHPLLKICLKKEFSRHTEIVKVKNNKCRGFLILFWNHNFLFL